MKRNENETAVPKGEGKKIENCEELESGRVAMRETKRRTLIRKVYISLIIRDEGQMRNFGSNQCAAPAVEVVIKIYNEQCVAAKFPSRAANAIEVNR